MISFAPLWKTMQEKGATTYTLQNKGKDYNVGSKTVSRLKAGMSVSTNTLDSICKILDCDLNDMIEYIKEFTPLPNPDKPEKHGAKNYHFAQFSFAFMIFSNDGALNSFLSSVGNKSNTSVLGDQNSVYWFQTAVDLWKSLGWSSIIYLAAITGIDQQIRIQMSGLVPGR